MTYRQKYRAWMTERARQINNAQEEQLLNDILLVVIIYEMLRMNSEQKKRIYKKKRFWVHPIFKLRDKYGFYEAIYPTLSRYEKKCFANPACLHHCNFLKKIIINYLTSNSSKHRSIRLQKLF